MRIAPLAFLLNPTESEDRVLIRDVCRITHHNDEAYVGALAIVLAIRAVLSGEWSPNRSFLAVAANRLPDSAVRDRIQALLPLRLSAIEVARSFGATGHVVDTVPLALYCAQSIADDPLPVVLTHTISVGGDTDTIASIAGQLAGSVVGSNEELSGHVSRIEGSADLLPIAGIFSQFIDNRG